MHVQAFFRFASATFVLFLSRRYFETSAQHLPPPPCLPLILGSLPACQQFLLSLLTILPCAFNYSYRLWKKHVDPYSHP